MDSNKIEQLKQRRLLLQEEVRLKALRDRISFQLEYLEAQGFGYTIFYEHENLEWLNSNLSFRKKDGYQGLYDFQIDVDDASEDCHAIICDSEASFVEQLKLQLLKITSKDNRLALCRDGGDPEIQMTVEAFLSNPSLFLIGTEAWLLLEDRSWLLEYISDQDIIRFIRLETTTPLMRLTSSIQKRTFQL